MAAPTSTTKTPKQDAELGTLSSSSSATHNAGIALDPSVLPKSRGVRKMELLESRINKKYLILLYGSFSLLAYVMSLDQYTNATYLTTATSVSFQAHSTLATISTIKAVFQAVSQPPIAKIADVAGRVEAYVLCVLLYVLGYIIQSTSNSIYQYAVGNAIYILGITGLFLLQNIIISDISDLRNRAFWTIFPSIPGVINVFVSGDVAQGVLSTSSWRWGIGMFGILVPFMAVPIILTLSIGMRERKVKEGETVAIVAPTAKTTFGQKVVNVFWSLDVVGLVLLVDGAGMVLVTITLANSRTARWSDPHSIALLTVGGLTCVSFVLWERFGARQPLIPFSLFVNRTVIASLCIAIFHPVAGGVAAGYLYTFFLVAANQSVKSATRINSIPSFTGTLAAAGAGLLARYTRRLKPIIIAGFIIEVLAIGLMIRYRQATNSRAELAIVQVIRGIGSGMIGFPVQAAIQSAARHEHTAAITAGYLTVYYLAGGVGRSIGGGIWTNVVPDRINAYMGDDALAARAYSNPIGFIAQYAPGTAPRIAVARAQDEAQRIIVSVACGIAAMGLIASLFLENIRLPDAQSVEEVEKRVDARDLTSAQKAELKLAGEKH